MVIISFLVSLAGATMLLLFAVRMVRTGIERSYGASFQRLLTQNQSMLGASATNIGDNAISTAYITGLANEDLTWERTTEVNLGFDYGFLKNRI